MVNWVKRNPSGAGTTSYLPRGGGSVAAPAKRGPGRPRKDADGEVLVHVTVCMTDRQIAAATEAGSGNISLGVRRIVDAHASRE